MTGSCGGLGGRFCVEILVLFTNINVKRAGRSRNAEIYRTVDIVFVLVLVFVLC